MKLMACCLLMLFPASLVAQEAASKLYPLKVGNTWHFKFTMGGQTISIVNKITSVEKVDGQELFRLEAKANDQAMASEDLRADAQGLFRHKFNGQEAKPPVQLLRNPIKVGETWKTTSEIAGESITTAVTVGREEVTVAAGKYKAVTAKMEAETNGQKFTTTYWFAEGVGMVKQTVTFPDGRTAVMELEKVELAK
jgi:hypothetical protein